MPWRRNTSRSSGYGGAAQTTLNIFFAFMVVILFLTIQSYRTSIDAMEAKIASLSAVAVSITQDEQDVGDGMKSTDTDAMFRYVSEMRDQVGTLDDRMETLASKSVDVGSMETLRDEMLVTQERLTEIESGLQALNAVAQDDGQTEPDGDSGSDIQKVMTEARATREELQQFKKLLGYGDM